MLVVGVLICFTGLVVIPSALNSEPRDPQLLGAALAFFGMGALILSLSLYFEARALRVRINADANLVEHLHASKRKMTCDNCKSSSPIIQCTMHRLNLCATCLVDHYEARGCVYVPAVRKTTGRASRAALAGRA